VWDIVDVAAKIRGQDARVEGVVESDHLPVPFLQDQEEPAIPRSLETFEAYPERFLGRRYGAYVPTERRSTEARWNREHERDVVRDPHIGVVALPEGRDGLLGKGRVIQDHEMIGFRHLQEATPGAS
jgi:hypothetical protein